MKKKQIAGWPVDQPLPVGKLDTDLLKETVFSHILHLRPEVLVRPGVGEDCATIDFGQYE